MSTPRETVWTFETARFRVECNFLPEDMDPADSFDFEDDIAAVRNGDVLWFCAEMRVIYKPTGAVIGRDVLGGCAYKTIEDFIAAHRTDPADSRNTLEAKARNTVVGHYFPDMVSQAVAEARKVASALS